MGKTKLLFTGGKISNNYTQINKSRPLQNACNTVGGATLSVSAHLGVRVKLRHDAAYMECPTISRLQEGDDLGVLGEPRTRPR